MRDWSEKDWIKRHQTERLDIGTGEKNRTEELDGKTELITFCRTFLILKEFAEMSQATVQVEREREKKNP